MASTPPPVSTRARTPPTPFHGDYEPYSPRRSKRSTAHRNPYSSFNNDRSPGPRPQHRTTTPPTTAKRARFARAPTQLSSPPSSPASPIKHMTPHRTPRKGPFTASKTTTSAQSDSDTLANSSLAPPDIDPITMLPTPAKTPVKRAKPAALNSARILRFEPNHPNDIMPSSRKVKTKRGHVTSGFELYEEEAGSGEGQGEIAIYTDANARVPEMDESEDNPFVGSKRSSTRSQRRRSRKNAEHAARDATIDAAAARNEGVTYVFRGKKIFRRFTEPDSDDSGHTDLSGSSSQRRLKHRAGAAAQRPLTRSAIKPRLLFPSEDQLHEREQGAEEHDSEAVTDVEMHNTSNPTAKPKTTPTQALVQPPTSPPSTLRSTRSKKRAFDSYTDQPTPIVEQGSEPMSVSPHDSFTSVGAGKRKMRSPFDTWQRAKAGVKRVGEFVEEGKGGGGKRSRSGAATTAVEGPV